nr:hypothetical protein [Tanacetum cinerariifolium]
MRRVGKGFSGVPAQGDDVHEHAAEEVATGVVSPTPTSPSPSSPVIPSSPPHQSPYDVENVFNQGMNIVDMDQDEGIELIVDQEKDAEVVAASTPIPAAKPKILKIAAAPAVSTRRRKGVKKDQVEMDAEYAKKLQEELDKEHEEAYKNIDWNAALDDVQSKEPQYIKRYHGIKKKPQSKSEVRKTMISYLKNTKGYKMEFFKGKTYDQILPIFQARFDVNMKFLFKSREEMEKEDEEIIKSINETPAQKASKRRKSSEKAQEADDLKKRLEIVQDEDDDVFVEATPLAQKVPVVDYQVVVIDNKPKYKIIRADYTHQLYISFITLLKNFDREDLETLWRISVYGLALVKRWKLLTSCGVHVIILSIVQLFLLVERRVGKGFSGVEIPLFETMLVVRDIVEDAEVQVPAQGDDVQEHAIEEVATEVVLPILTSPSPSSPVLDTCSALVLRVEGLENVNAAQQLEIVKLKTRVKKLEKLNQVKSSKLRRLNKVGTSQRVESLDDMENVSNQGRNVVDMDQDEGIELVVDHKKDVEVKGRHADKQAEIYNIDLDHSSKVLSMQKDDTDVQEAVEVVTTAKLITEVVTDAATQVVAASTPIPAAKPKILKIVAAPAVSTRKRKGVVIRDLEEELHIDTPAETPTVKDKGKGILIEVPKPLKKKDHVEIDAEYAKKLQEELDKEHEEAYKNIDWNAALDHVQSKEPLYIKRYHGIKKKPQSESEARKNMISYLKNTECYKMEFFKGKTKLSEEAQEADDLKKRLEIVQDEDDDVFVEATLLAQKVPVVDYQVVVIENKPKYKIIRANDTHQFYISFTSLLRNFDREDLETLWRIESKECLWFSIGEKIEAADFMWCSCDYSLNSSALLIG